MKKFISLMIVCFFLSCGGGGGDDSPNPTPTPTPTPPDDSFAACLPTVSNQSLDIVTWNIENYPQSGSTEAAVLDIINEMDPDVIAIQELTSMAEFADLLAELSGWTGGIVQFNGSNLMLGYLFKTSEVSVVTQPVNLFNEQNDDNDFAFTAFRRPLLTKITHMNGLEVSLINVHLKCCDGSEDRRRSASVKIKEYIDTNLAMEPVVVLGDFNDEIVDASDNVFQNFIDDAANYRFSTIDIANGPQANWSYPSWPSQIDQILITDELFERVTQTETMRLDQCSDSYLNSVSDHRPIMISLNNN